MKGKNSGGIISYAWLILAAILFVPVISVPAAENAGKVSVPFANKSVLLSWNWNDFKESSYTENRRLAAAGIAIAGNAAASDYGSSPYAKVEKTVRALGFTKNIKHLYYSSTKEDYPGMTFAMSSQKVGGKTVVLAVFKGTSSWDDIVTDAKSQLDGFQPAGKHALSELKKYLSGQKLTSKNTILYIVGHSYGGAVASLVAVFALITPSYIDTALYGKTITIDDELFRTTMSETEGGETFLQGRQIVCFYSTACGYCRKAAKKVHIAMGNAHIDADDVRIVFWHTNPDKPVEEFFEKSGVPPLQYVEIPTATFLEITQGSMPVIAFVDNGDVKECHKYIELNERQMSNFLSKKQ